MRFAILLCLPALLYACVASQDAPAEREDTAPDLADPSWVSIYDPNAAWNGFTLVYRSRAYPMLIDMRGRAVHAWPQVRSKSRARLLPNCNLLVISRGRGVAEWDWEGNKVWHASFEGRFPHHDLIRLANGNTMVLTRAEESESDDVVEVNPQGKIVWMWESAAPLAEPVESGRRRHSGDTTHLNSVHELPDNPWFHAGDERFRPGNVLLSARNLNLVFIVDKPSGDIVWSYRGELDLQHEALMLDAGSEHNGRLVIFDNRYASFETERGSRVIELDPRDNSITWSYAQPGFFSATAGAQQPLPNGNVLIGSSMGRRAFEVDRAGRTVWEWSPPFRLNRPSRYAADFCPRLAELGGADGPPVRPAEGYRHVDHDSYRFSRANDRAELEIAGATRRVLEDDGRCAGVLLPSRASIRLGYGIDRAALAASDATGYEARFSLVLRNPANDREAIVFEESMGGESSGWRERTLDLAELSHQPVEVCVRLEETGAPARDEDGSRLAWWGAPVIKSADFDDEEGGDEPGPADLTAEELEVRREHLRAMGYIN